MYPLPADVDLHFLVGLELIQVCVGESQVILNFDRATSISLECPFELNGQIVQAPELLPLVSHRVTNADAIRPSRVTLTFSNGCSLAFEDSCPEFESYQISSPDRMIIV
jgi:hypothetical protein